MLDPDELSLMNRGFRKMESHLPYDTCSRTTGSESTPNAHEFCADYFEFEQSIYNSMSCNALNVFDKNPEPGVSEKGMQDVQGKHSDVILHISVCSKRK